MWALLLKNVCDLKDKKLSITGLGNRKSVWQTSSTRDAKGTALRKGRKKEREREEHRYEKMAMNKYLSIVILNLNGLNSPVKRHRIAEWIRKHDPHICYLQETHLRTKTYTD